MSTRSDRKALCFATASMLIHAGLDGRLDSHLVGTAHAAPSDSVDPMTPYRDRFRTGMDRYKEGAFAEAIVVWEAIYRELGPAKAYRLAFNLGRAYEAYGDSVRAAERYESYVAEVARRAELGEIIEDNVLRQAGEAKARLVDLSRGKGTIRVLAAEGRPSLASVDQAEARATPFTVRVMPGAHVVVFDPRTPREFRTDITVAEDGVVEVRPRATPAESVADATRPVELAAPKDAPALPTRPYPLWVPLAVGGASILAVAIPVFTYRHALDLQERHDDPATASADRAGLAADYDDARRTAYFSLAIPIVLAAGTGALLAGYFLGGAAKPPSSAIHLGTDGSRVGVRF